MAIDIDALIAEQKKYLESIEPVDVPVMLGGVLVTVRIPFVMPPVFTELTDKHPAVPGVAADMSLWFSLTNVTRHYPDISLIVGDDEDDLLVVRDKAVFYRWTEIYDSLSDEDKSNLRAAVWGMHIWEPAQKAKAAADALPKDLPLGDVVDAVVAGVA